MKIISTRINQSRGTFINRCKLGVSRFSISVVQDKPEIYSRQAVELASVFADPSLLTHDHLRIIQDIAAEAIYPKFAQNAEAFAR